MILFFGGLSGSIGKRVCTFRSLESLTLPSQSNIDQVHYLDLLNKSAAEGQFYSPCIGLAVNARVHC